MKRAVWFGVFLAGFSSMLAQIVVLREALAGFYGNELILGIVLASWLLVTGVGTYVGRKASGVKDKVSLYSSTQIFLAFTAPVTVLVMRAFRAYLFTPGELVGVVPAVLYSLIMLLPFCIVSGFQFTLAASVASYGRRDGASWASNVYVVSALGHLAGGLLFSFLLVHSLNAFETTYVVVYLNLVSAASIAHSGGNRRLACVSAILLALSALFLASQDLDTFTTRLQYPGQNLVLLGKSIYGSIVVTETQGQLNFYENGFPLFSTENQQASEEKVHYAMLAHPSPENVLLISGGIAGTAREALKYNPELVDYVELDPALIEVARNYTRSLDDARIRVYAYDARIFVRNSSERYDVAVIDLPDPSSIQINRYYTLEFFRELKAILTPAGVVSLHLSSGENYVSDESSKLNAAVYQTLASVFKNVLVVPGSTNYYIASDAPLDYDYPSKLSERGITTKYFEYYLPGTLTEDRISSLKSVLMQRTRLNTDFMPVSQYYYLTYWMSMFRVDYGVVAALAVIAVLAGLVVSKVEPIPLTIFVTGFSAMALELIILTGFQVIYGFVYAKVGLIVTAFMFGDFLGAYVGNVTVKEKFVKPRLLSKLDFVLSAYCILTPLILLNLSYGGVLHSLSGEALILLLTVLLGFLVGVEFPVAVKTHLSKAGSAVDSAATLASLDLMGACVGALLLSVVLIPLYGVVKVAFFVGFLNLASGLYVWFKEG